MISDSEFCKNRVRLFGFLWHVRCEQKLPMWRGLQWRACPACGHVTYMPKLPMAVRVPKVEARKAPHGWNLVNALKLEVEGLKASHSDATRRTI